VSRVPTRGSGWFSSRTAWLFIAVIAVAVLAIGSSHGGGSNVKAREAQLDSLIKCPACQDLSIAQSDAPSSMALRRRVAGFVKQAWSNARIEAWVTGRYGTDALLVPPSSGANATLYIVPVAAIGLAVAGLGWYLWSRRPAALEEADDELAGPEDPDLPIKTR